MTRPPCAAWESCSPRPACSRCSTAFRTLPRCCPQQQPADGRSCASSACATRRWTTRRPDCPPASPGWRSSWPPASRLRRRPVRRGRRGGAAARPASAGARGGSSLDGGASAPAGGTGPEERTLEEPERRPAAVPPAQPAVAGGESSFWPAFAAEAKRKLPSAGPYLVNPEKTVGTWKNGVLTLWVDSAFTKAMLNKPNITEVLAQAAGQRFGGQARVAFQIGKPSPEDLGTGQARKLDSGTPWTPCWSLGNSLTISSSSDMVISE